MLFPLVIPLPAGLAHRKKPETELILRA